MVRTVTWQSPRGERIDVTVEAEKILDAAHIWPKDSHGDEYCQVYRGAHLTPGDDPGLIDETAAYEMVEAKENPRRARRAPPRPDSIAGIWYWGVHHRE